MPLVAKIYIVIQLVSIVAIIADEVIGKIKEKRLS